MHGMNIKNNKIKFNLKSLVEKWLPISVEPHTLTMEF